MTVLYDQIPSIFIKSTNLIQGKRKNCKLLGPWTSSA